VSKIELREELASTYQIPDGPGACLHLYKKAICELDERFCIFMVIDEYPELVRLNEEIHGECLTAPKIPRNPLVVWQRLKKRRLAPTSYVPPENEEEY